MKSFARLVVIWLAGFSFPAFLFCQTNATKVSSSIGANQVSIMVSGGERVIRANGLPDHPAGPFPRKGNPNRISAQKYDFHLPLSPRALEKATPVRGAIFGVAVNGVPFDPGTAEFWNGDPNWNYEAKSGFIDLGLDDNNAHVQPNGAYHYHALPKGLLTRLGGENARMMLLGYAADGFPIYNNYGHSDPKDLRTPLRKLRSSYQLKAGLRQGGPGGKIDGKFTSDWEYVARLGDLDDCNGTFGVTTEYPTGIYHYHITDQFPYIPRCWRGAPDPSFQKRGPGPPTERPAAPPKPQ
jgi:hypothetical protein